MNSKKLKVSILLGVFLVSMLLGIYSLGDIKYSNKEGLSYDEKKADAKYLMNFLEKTYPYFDEVKTSTGQDLLKEKEKIVSSICKTSSDKDFYIAINKLLNRFTYGHAKLNISTDPYDMPYIYLYEGSETSKKNNLKNSNEIKSKWESIQKEYRDDLGKPQYSYNIDACYINGSYYITMSQNPEVHVGDQILSINGISLEEYGQTVPFNDKYDLIYDYDNEKYIIPFPFNIKSNPPKEVIIKTPLDEEKKVEVLPFDPKKTILENGFKAFESSYVMNDEDKVQGKFLNTFESNKIMTLNFSAINGDTEYINSPLGINKLLSKISESDYLILDIRRSYSPELISDILSFVLPEDVSYYDYKIVEKNEINDAHINFYRSGYHPSTTEVTSSIASLEKTYPLSKYHIFQDKIVDFKGMNKYKGKVFILYDKFFSIGKLKEMLKTIIDYNYCTLVSNGKLTLNNYYDSSFTTSVTLPNSNLVLSVQNAKVVDIDGNFVGKVVVTPQVIVKDDPSKIIDKLKKGEGYVPTISEEDKYTSKDEYFNEVLKLIK